MNNAHPLLLPYADVARSTGPKTPPEPSWPGSSLQLCRDTIPGLETQHGLNPWKPNSLRQPSKAVSGARKRPLADVTNSPNLARSESSCETCEVAWTESAGSSQIVMLVDLDNWPNFFQTIPCSLPFHVAAFHRTNNTALKLGDIHRSAAVQDLGRRLLMVNTIKAKDSADCGIIMKATELMNPDKNPDMSLIVLSNDDIFQQMQVTFNAKRKRMARITGQKMGDLEALLRAWDEHTPLLNTLSTQFAVGKTSMSPRKKKQKRRNQKSANSREPSQSPSHGRRDRSSSPASPRSRSVTPRGQIKFPVPRPASCGVQGFRAAGNEHAERVVTVCPSFR